MADVKISALPVAGALAASDVLPMVQPSGTTKVALSVLDGRWLSSATGGTVNGGLTVNPYLAVGTNPAQSGPLRLPNNQWVMARSGANNADLPILMATSGNVTHLNGTGAVAITLGGSIVAQFTGALATVSPPIAIGTNPATTGAVRLPNNQGIVARNAANSGDMQLIALSSSDQLVVGTSTTSSTAINSSGNTLFGINGVQQFNVLNNLLNFKDDFHIYAGTTIGLRIGGTASQKLGFYGATPVVRPTGTPAAATDAATTMALVNDLRAKLIALGLIG